MMVDQLAPTPWTKNEFAIYDANKQWVLAVMIYLDEDSRQRAIEIRDRVTAAVNATADISTEALEDGAIQGLTAFIRGIGYFNSGRDCGTCDYPTSDCDANAKNEHCLGAEARQLLAQLKEVTPSASQRK